MQKNQRRISSFTSAIIQVEFGPVKWLAITNQMFLPYNLNVKFDLDKPNALFCYGLSLLNIINQIINRPETERSILFSLSILINDFLRIKTLFTQFFKVVFHCSETLVAYDMLYSASVVFCSFVIYAQNFNKKTLYDLVLFIN